MWGFSFLFIKVAVAGFNPVTVAAGRVGLGALALVAVLSVRGMPLPRDRRVWRHLAVMGVVGNAVPFTALAWGEEQITSALASVLNATTPLFTAAIAASWDRERLRPGQLIGLAVGLGGVAVATGLGSSDVAGTHLTRALGPILATAAYGVAINYTKRHLLDVAPAAAACGQLMVATAVLLPVAVVTSITGSFSVTPTRALSVVLLGVFGTGIAWVIFYGMVAELGPTRSSLVTYLVPIVAVMAGVTFLSEPLTSRLVLGAVLVIVGVLAVNQYGVAAMMRRLRPGAVAMLLLVVLAAGLLVGCGDSDGESGACGEVTTDPVDPASLNHVVAGGPEPSYVVDPPSSGAHLPLELNERVLRGPLSRPEQVGLLELGAVLIQHRGLADGEAARLEELASVDVYVAPNPDLADPVVATAWVHTLRCSEVDAGALEDFVSQFASQGPAADDPSHP